MERRNLGSNGPELTTIGFGCWAMGGSEHQGMGWGPQDDPQSIEAVHAALDHGINWYDTAAVYGFGHSEEVLGRALGNRRKDVFVATKFGLVWDDQGNLTNNSSYESVMRECDASLRRLGTDFIDLYQQHWPDMIGTPVEESMRALDDLIKAGKVRYAGVSNFDIPLLERALTVRHVDSLQPKYNLFDPEVDEETLPFCRDHGIGVVAYSPLASGLLGGKYTENQKFDERDWRSKDPNFTGEGLRQNLQKVAQLRAIADRYDRTVAQLAISWVLANPAVTSAIVGVRKPDHILGAIPAADWHLDDRTLQEIKSIMSPQEAGIA